MEKQQKAAEIISEKPQRVRRRRRRIGCFMLMFLFIFFFVCGICSLTWAGGWLKDFTCSIVLEESFIWNKAGCEKTTESTGESGSTISMQLPTSSTSLEDLTTAIIEQASPAVVTVNEKVATYDSELNIVDREKGIGSGFIVDTSGIIVTNQHVVSDEEGQYSVVLPGEDTSIPVDKIYRDRTNDIALLKISKSDLSALSLGDSSILKRGNLVIAIGSPFGDLPGTTTVGFITGVGRDVDASSGFMGTVTHYEDVIQTDAAINPGNSGGPLLNSKGEVIGINFATTSGADGTSFAIPVNRLKDRLDVFKSQGHFPQPYIGISYSQRTLFVNGEAVTGAVILSVESGGPAERAGVKKGDIILSVDSNDLSSASLADIIQKSEVGVTLKLEIQREGQTLEIDVTVADKGE